MKMPKFTALLLAGSLVLAVAACGTPTVDGAEKRYKSNKDRISVLATKQPASKTEFDTKLAEFEKEFAEAMTASSDEDKIRKIGELNSRMDKYIAAFETPAAGAPGQGGEAAPSNKLDGAAGTPPVDAAAGGKLDTGMGGGAVPVQPGSGGMGGGAAPAQPATAPAQPAGGGMGGM